MLRGRRRDWAGSLKPPESPFCPAHGVEPLLPSLACSNSCLWGDGDPKADDIGEAWIDVIRSVKAMEKLIQITVTSYALKAVN